MDITEATKNTNRPKYLTSTYITEPAPYVTKGERSSSKGGDEPKGETSSCKDT